MKFFKKEDMIYIQGFVTSITVKLYFEDAGPAQRCADAINALTRELGEDAKFPYELTVSRKDKTFILTPSSEKEEEDEIKYLQ